MVESSLLTELARSFLAGEPTVEQIVIRTSRTLGRRWRWLRPLAQRYVARFSDRVRPRHREAIQFLRQDQGFARAWQKHASELRALKWRSQPQVMQAAPATAAWDIPQIDSPGALAEWLGITSTELCWYSDLRALGYKQRSPLLRHYHYRTLAKQPGSVRMIEAPKPRLKELQRQILERILERIPPHEAVHGFVKGRSITTFAAPHVGRRVVLRMDLKDFFPTFSGARIQSFFRTLGYPENVADLLGGICTNATPRDAWEAAAFDIDRESLSDARSLYARPHLPQGASTSPALANLCTYRVDCRLQGLAHSVGVVYTRYADDLAFSSDEETFERGVERFSIHVAAILMEEGFRVHHRKTRVMRQGVRQRLVGIVVNQRLNVIRRDYDCLKAILTNCVRCGPDTQNREGHPNFRSHLEGRVAFVEMINPMRGQRLHRILRRITW